MNFVNAMAVDLGIQQLQSESEQNFTGRVILSSLSKWMLTSCFSSENETSVEMIRAITAEKLSLFRDVINLGPVSLLDTDEFEDISDYIYKILVENGAFYHKAYYVIPRERQLIPLGKASIILGMQPEEHCIFSGLAPISLDCNGFVNIADIFDLPELTADETINLVWKRSSPVEKTTIIGEYLKFDKLRQGYYAARRYDTNSVTMGRSVHTATGYEHYIIKENEIRRIPDDLVSCGYQEYCRLAVINSAARQAVHAQIDPCAVRLRFDYKLPANDLRFLRFIAWPVSVASLNSPFEFIIHPQIWPAIQKRLQYLNYKVV